MPVPEGLSGLIATAVTPVALVTPCAILLSAYFNKHAGLSGQARDLTAELRQDTTGYERVLSLVKQVQWFQRRVNLVWAATLFLSFALLLFLTTVFSVLFVGQEVRFGLIGATTMVAGLTCICIAVWLDFSEIVLARRTLSEELVHAVRDATRRNTVRTRSDAGDTAGGAE